MFFGLAGLFGKWIDLPPALITWSRCAFAFVALFFMILFSKERFVLKQTRHYFVFAGLGLLYALHWWAFFYSIQISTVAIGLLSFSTFPVFTVFLEPFFFRERIRKTDIVSALAVFGGIALIVPGFNLNNSITLGAAVGVLSGLSFAVLQIFNRKYIQTYSGIQITFYQTGSAAIILLPLVSFGSSCVTSTDIFLLMLLGVLCTAVAHTLFISGFKSVKVRTASIIAGLEPVYGIIAAMLLLHEIPSLKVICGGIVILAVSMWVSVSN